MGCLVSDTYLTIGDLAERSGLPISTLHFYERKGLIASARNAANHRVYRREILRRVTIIKVAQSLGIPLSEIVASLSHPPRDTTPDAVDRARISAGWHADLTRRIELMSALRDRRGMCIGCGCLSMRRCPLFNEDDHLAEQGPGARLLQTGEPNVLSGRP